MKALALILLLALPCVGQEVGTTTPTVTLEHNYGTPEQQVYIELPKGNTAYLGPAQYVPVAPRSIMKNDPFPGPDPNVILAIMQSNLTGDLKVAALKDYLAVWERAHQASLTRQEQRGNNWKDALLTLIPIGLGIWGVAK